MVNYYHTMLEAIQQGPHAVEATMPKFIKDAKLMNHIRFFMKSFPGYKLIINYMMAEGDHVFVKVTFRGTHQGTTAEIPSTYHQVVTPFALGYTIKNEKIIDFWAIANELEFFEQLGLSREEVEVKKQVFSS